MGSIVKKERLLEKIAALIKQARGNVAHAINCEMVLLYWNIGKIVKEEIVRNKRARYGEQIIQSISSQLAMNYGTGFSSQNIWHMVKFYEVYPILSAMRRELEGLSWTHIKTIIYLNDKLKRAFYVILCKKEQWNTRMLEGRTGTSYKGTSYKDFFIHKNGLSLISPCDNIITRIVQKDFYALFKRH
ncbi:MAG: DUF1016 N-terminal domain-containing protein [Candidatus Omnitrophica bacterium]|nr:DUF1016 N-terminal domain-containing protein [Candidatus Omnitrophota bacterium]